MSRGATVTNLGDEGMLGREWVYYVPELETVCIIFPDWVYEDGRNPCEWGLEYLSRAVRIDARKDSETRNAIYIGDL